MVNLQPGIARPAGTRPLTLLFLCSMVIFTFIGLILAFGSSFILHSSLRAIHTRGPQGRLFLGRPGCDLHIPPRITSITDHQKPARRRDGPRGMCTFVIVVVVGRENREAACIANAQRKRVRAPVGPVHSAQSVRSVQTRGCCKDRISRQLHNVTTTRGHEAGGDYHRDIPARRWGLIREIKVVEVADLSGSHCGEALDARH